VLFRSMVMHFQTSLELRVLLLTPQGLLLY